MPRTPPRPQATIPTLLQPRDFNELDDEVCRRVDPIGNYANHLRDIDTRIKFLDGVLQWIITWRNKAEEEKADLIKRFGST